MSDTKLDPASLTAEERAIVDHEASRFHRDWAASARYQAAMNLCEPIILARRALFAPEKEEAKVAAVSPHGVWRCECCAAIADPIDSAFRWNGECWQHHHAEAQTHYDCRFFGPSPDPAPPAEKVECPNCGDAVEQPWSHFPGGWRCPTLPAKPERVEAERVDTTKTVAYCDELDARYGKPAATEMPEAVRDAIDRLRVIAITENFGRYKTALNDEADALESFWRDHIAQPVTPPLAMSEALETVLNFAQGTIDMLPDESWQASYYPKIHHAIAAVRAQATAPKVR